MTYNAIRRSNTGEWAAVQVTEKDGKMVHGRVLDTGNKRQAIKAAGTNRVIA